MSEESFQFPVVLVLAEVELISFIVTGMELCVGFVLETVLIIQGCFHSIAEQCLHTVKALHHSISQRAAGQAGGAQGAAREHRQYC